jgi:hypothetical protein
MVQGMRLAYPSVSRRLPSVDPDTVKVSLAGSHAADDR